MELLYLCVGLLLGALLAALFVYNRFMAGGQYIASKTVSDRYVLKEIVRDLEERFIKLELEIKDKSLKIIDLHKEVSSQEQINVSLDEKLNTQKDELSNLEKRFQTEFENVAHRLLTENSEKFTTQNAQNLSNVLMPLNEKIKEFERNIDHKFLNETRERASLKNEIENLQKLNQQLSQDAHNLVSALRGNSKTQGDWGEIQLEMLLEKAGLLRGVHYQKQLSFNDNGQQKRPDFIIQLPDNKQVIIDSKVSLVAYEQFFNSDEPIVKSRYLKAHTESLRNHVRGLSDKNYEGLYQINSPDYVLMFVPIEPAFGVALQEDISLFTDALERNVVIVTASTLLATMRTVTFIWKQENQKRNVLEIARQSGLLYDKFVAFVDDLKQIGQRLESANGAYNDAMNKLTDSRKFGDTLIGRAEKIRELGAKASKRLPKNLITTEDDEILPLAIDDELI